MADRQPADEATRIEVEENPSIEAAIAADEAVWAKREQGQTARNGEKPRNQSGQFTSATDKPPGDEPEGDGPRAPEGEANAQAEGQSGKQPAETPKPKQDDAPKPGAEKPAEQLKQSTKQDNRSQDNRSPFAKNADRQDRTWENLNKRKAEADAREEQLKLREESFEANRKAASRPVVDERGYTAQQYRTAHEDFARQAGQAVAQAVQLENAGRLNEADRFNREAERLTNIANGAKQSAERLERMGSNDVWSQLVQDAPESLQAGSPLYKQMRDMLTADKGLDGNPYRALIKIGRAELQKTEKELATSKVEAAKVPGLLKQIETLTAKVRELTEATALTADGDANLVREGAGGSRFEDLPFKEQEAWIERDLASRR